MGDTPSNYNEANLWFHSLNANQPDKLGKLDEQNEEESQAEARLPRKKKKGRKKKKDLTIYWEPNDWEKLMAEAYGGEAKPVPIKANRSISSARSKQGLTRINWRMTS